MEDLNDFLEDVPSKKTEQVIEKLTEREHILARPSMYIGSITLEETEDYILDEGRFSLRKIKYVPGLVKIFNELIDNSIDENVRTNGKYATKIEVNINKDTFYIKDNGRGIPVKKVKIPEGEVYQPELAWTHARAGSNFRDSNSSTIGTNGVGSMAASVFSKEFTGISHDGANKCTVECTSNNKNIKTSVRASKQQGVAVNMKPDLERFNLKEINEDHIKVIEQRLYNLSVSYPNITFKLNNKRIKINHKNFMEMFGENGVFLNTDNFSIGIFHSNTDDFRQFSLMNGLNLKDGGTHIDYISSNIVSRLREKIVKKYKTIKPADIKQKLFLVVIMKDFKNPKYRSQTKEALASSTREITDYFSDIDFDKYVAKIYKEPNIIDSIIDYFKIKEEFKKKQELKGLEKNKKKIKSEKYTKAIGTNEMLVICEGRSAFGGISPVLGRKGIAYYELKGKPMNVIAGTQSKFTSNKELSELYKIIKQEGFKKIVMGTDADLDGYSITGLSTAFFYKYLKQDVLETNSFYMLRTPIVIELKGGKITNWVYKYDEIHELKGQTKFMKGIGSWKKKDLQYVMEKDGIESMLEPLTYSKDDDEIIANWYETNKTDKRKEYIKDNEFSLIKL